MPVWVPLSTIRLGAVGLLVAAACGAEAQGSMPTQQIRIAPHHSVRTSETSRRRGMAAMPRVAYRGLTVNRRREALPDELEDRDDILVDGPIRYGDIHSFNPVPYASSGQQFPYGFDGIGGYGSDLGIGAGQNASIYDRGP